MSEQEYIVVSDLRTVRGLTMSLGSTLFAPHNPCIPEQERVAVFRLLDKWTEAMFRWVEEHRG